MAVGRDRPEFLAVARLAADLGRPIGARDVLRELVGELPEIVGWKVIDRAVALDLLTREETRGPARLSEAGRLALTHGEVLVAEEGLWRLYYADDPLIPQILLHAERLEAERAKDERDRLREERKRGGPRSPAPDRPDGLLRGAEGGAPRPSVATGKLLQLQRLSDRGEAAEAGTARLELRWEEEAALHLTTSLQAPPGGGALAVDTTLDLPPSIQQISRPALWSALVSQATGVPTEILQQWARRAGMAVLPARFDELAEAERRTFVTELKVPKSTWRDLGDFEATTLPRVKRVPASDDDAQRWCVWLQWDQLDDYATPATLEVAAASVLKRFPHHRPRPLSADELLHRARRERGDRAWNLLAPFDLGLWS